MNEQLLNELYQVLASLNAPERVLDQVMAAIEGQPLPHETLLPFVADNPWQPIETAPRDIVFILVRDGWDNVFRVSTVTLWSNRQVGKSITRYQPTHWMSLPPSPESEI